MAEVHICESHIAGLVVKNEKKCHSGIVIKTRISSKIQTVFMLCIKAIGSTVVEILTTGKVKAVSGEAASRKISAQICAYTMSMFFQNRASAKRIDFNKSFPEVHRLNKLSYI